MSYIIGKIWIGDKDDAVDKGFHKKNNINAILTCAYELHDNSGIVKYYLKLPMFDSSHQSLRIPLKLAKEFLNNPGITNVLVHCSAGISRSCSIVIGYLIIKGWKYEDALKLVQSKRKICNPNSGFRRQLKNLF